MNESVPLHTCPTDWCHSYTRTDSRRTSPPVTLTLSRATTTCRQPGTRSMLITKHVFRTSINMGYYSKYLFLKQVIRLTINSQLCRRSSLRYFCYTV